jgi:hypothetical protein
VHASAQGRLCTASLRRPAHASPPGEQVLSRVAAHRVLQRHRSRSEAAGLLAAHDLVVDLPLVDEQRVAPDVPGFERQDVLGDA